MSNHKQGRGCPKCAVELRKKLCTITFDEYLNIFKQVHGSTYEYLESTKRESDKFTVYCKIHGDFITTPKRHRRGQGCPKCGLMKSSKSLIILQEQNLKIFKNKHSYNSIINYKLISKQKSNYKLLTYIGYNNYNYINKYLYLSNNYKNISKIEILCKIHGIFKQSVKSHKEGSACPKCSQLNLKGGWSYKEWMNRANTSKNFHGYKVYILLINNNANEEQFIKIGRTYTSIHKRFQNKLNYSYIIIKEISFEDAKECCDYESYLLSLLKQYSYKPLKHFSGKSECFSTESLKILRLN